MSIQTALGPSRQPMATKPAMRFSLYFFSGDGRGSRPGKYDYIMRMARLADDYGFHAVWTPERHFQGFGGLFPNPSVLSAALAVTTSQIQIRGGSVVFPLHHVLRVIEEWSVVDNLSNGRVGISLASGWHPNDFVLMPGTFASRRQITFDGIALVRRLWAGQEMEAIGPDEKLIAVEPLPRPIQPALPLWLACSITPETYRVAGEQNCNVLTALLEQSMEVMAQRIAEYKTAREGAGHTGEPEVTVLLHTFLGTNTDEVKEAVRAPLTTYLTQFMTQSNLPAAAGGGLACDDQQTGVEFAFERYFQRAALLGTPEKCASIIERLAGVGVTEVACLIDFGVDPKATESSLSLLRELKDAYTT